MLLNKEVGVEKGIINSTIYTYIEGYNKSKPTVIYYNIEIKETLSRVIEIEVSPADEAID